MDCDGLPGRIFLTYFMKRDFPSGSEDFPSGSEDFPSGSEDYAGWEAEYELMHFQNKSSELIR